MRFAISTVTTLAVASVALGQEFPDPNPVPQADGTNLWYVGNNTQYPVIQDVLEAVSDGDEVVVRGGLYVESLHIDNNELTIRPFVNGDAAFEAVTFLNPTEGFNNDNGWAIKWKVGVAHTLDAPVNSPNFQMVLTLKQKFNLETRPITRPLVRWSKCP